MKTIAQIFCEVMEARANDENATRQARKCFKYEKKESENSIKFHFADNSVVVLSMKKGQAIMTHHKTSV